MTLDDRRHNVIRERRPVRPRFRIPGEQDAEELLLGELDGELVDTALVHLAAKVPGRPLAVGTHAAIEPFLQRQMDVQVDRADQATRRAAPIVRYGWRRRLGWFHPRQREP